MKLHYFEQEEPDDDDIQLQTAIQQGYVPEGCLLGGMLVMSKVSRGFDPCEGCNGPRTRCGGRRKVWTE